ncbi:23S ribosomal RNA methyltransferase [Tricholoma matsutake]|nr:23S ribosomal RNA methyltransferase [Tricholoma matsutake 945]
MPCPGPFRPSLPSLVSKAKTSSSRAWVARQFRDPYVKQRLASPTAYRTRSAFKLLEMDQKFGFLSRPSVRAVVDLGAAPGGWSQVIAGKLGFMEGLDPRGMLKKRKMKTKNTGEEALVSFDPLNIDDVDLDTLAANTVRRATIVAVDLLPIQPIPGVQTVQADFLSPQTDLLIHAMLTVEGNPKGKADVILSDMAANMSGNVVQDVERSLEICEGVYEFARKRLRPGRGGGKASQSFGGTLLLKHFTHPLVQRFRMQKLAPNFHSVLFLKPQASRSESKEGYFLCQGWKGFDSY